MTRTHRHCADPLPLRLLAMLACLLLIVAPAYAMPTRAGGAAHHADRHALHVAARSHGHPATPATPATADHACCKAADGGCIGHVCACAAGGAGVLATFPLRELAWDRAVALRGSARDAAIPDSRFAPPLRPPSR